MSPIKKLKYVILFALLFVLCGAIVSIVNGEELYNYKVYGQNVRTGLVVAGHIWETDKNGNLVAKVWDEFNIHEQCAGYWVGYGVAEVECDNGNKYVLEVIEE